MLHYLLYYPFKLICALEKLSVINLKIKTYTYLNLTCLLETVSFSPIDLASSKKNCDYSRKVETIVVQKNMTKDYENSNHRNGEHKGIYFIPNLPLPFPLI